MHRIKKYVSTLMLGLSLSFPVSPVLLPVGVVALSSTQTACDKNKIHEAAKASDRMATLIGSLIDAKRELGPTGQTCTVLGSCISTAEELVLTQHLLTANSRVKDFNNFARTLKEDTPQARLDLANVFSKVTEAINKLSNEAIFPVKNAEAKKRLLAILNSINTSIQIIDTALKG